MKLPKPLAGINFKAECALPMSVECPVGVGVGCPVDVGEGKTFFDCTGCHDHGTYGKSGGASSRSFFDVFFLNIAIASMGGLYIYLHLA